MDRDRIVLKELGIVPIQLAAVPIQLATAPIQIAETASGLERSAIPLANPQIPLELVRYCGIFERFGLDVPAGVPSAALSSVLALVAMSGRQTMKISLAIFATV